MGTENKNTNMEALRVEEGPKVELKGGPSHEYGLASAHTIDHGLFFDFLHIHRLH